MGRRLTGSITYLPALDKWQVRVTDPKTKKRRSAVVDSEAEAIDVRDEALAQILDGQDAKGTSLTLGGYILRWLEEHRRDFKAETFQDYEGLLRKWVLTDHVAELPIKDVRASHLHRLLNKRLRKQLSTNSRRNVKVALSLCLKEACKEEGVISTNPLREVDVEDRHDARSYYKFSRSDLGLLLEDERVGLTRRLRYAITFYLGQRSGDVWGIKMRDIDLDQKRITIFCNKQKKRITYPLLPGCISAIVRWTKYLGERRHNPDALLFPSKNTGRERRKNSGNPIRQLRIDCKMLGIVPAPGTRITWHSWRGTLATALQAGWLGERWSADEAASMLGHASVETTRRHYTQHAYLTPSELLGDKAAASQGPTLRLVRNNWQESARPPADRKASRT